MSGSDPAFPELLRSHVNNHLSQGACGLTKREYFAAVAMQGRLAAFVPEDGPIVPEMVAKFSLHCADALLAELESAERGDEK